MIFQASMWWVWVTRNIMNFSHSFIRVRKLNINQITVDAWNFRGSRCYKGEESILLDSEVKMIQLSDLSHCCFKKQRFRHVLKNNAWLENRSLLNLQRINQGKKSSGEEGAMLSKRRNVGVSGQETRGLHWQLTVNNQCYVQGNLLAMRIIISKRQKDCNDVAKVGVQGRNIWSCRDTKIIGES